MVRASPTRASSLGLSGGEHWAAGSWSSWTSAPRPPNPLVWSLEGEPPWEDWRRGVWRCAGAGQGVPWAPVLCCGGLWAWQPWGRLPMVLQFLVWTDHRARSPAQSSRGQGPGGSLKEAQVTWGSPSSLICPPQYPPPAGRLEAAPLLQEGGAGWPLQTTGRY